MSERRAVLLLGSHGMLARAIAEILDSDEHYSQISPSEEECDITSPQKLEAALARYRPHALINCAAYTDVDGCERDPGLAEAVNAKGAGNVARACRNHDVFLAHISTDFVFDGKASVPYRETHLPKPLSVYGASKLAGESLVKENCPRHLIVRTAWTFGPYRQNFVEKILALARRQAKLSVVKDQTGSPTFTYDLGRAILSLIEMGASGIFHVVNQGFCSRYEFAKAILEEAGLTNVEVEATLSTPAPGVAARPVMSALDTHRLQKTTGKNLRPWREALAEYIRRFGRQ